MPALKTRDEEIIESLAGSSISEKDFNRIVATSLSVENALQLEIELRAEKEKKERKVQDEINAFNQEEDEIQKQKIAEISAKKADSKEGNTDGYNIDANLIEFRVAEVKTSNKSDKLKSIEKFFEKYKETIKEITDLGKEIIEGGLMGNKEPVKLHNSFVEQSQEKHMQTVEKIKTVANKKETKEFLEEYCNLLQEDEGLVKSSPQGQALFNSLAAMICLIDHMKRDSKQQNYYSQKLVFANRLMQLNNKDLDMILGY